MSVLATPGFDLIPSAERVPTAYNYLTTFDFMSQYLPDTYEKEFERYGNRSISSFLRLVGAEMPSNSDLIKWSEQGRLHVKYTNCAVRAIDLAGVATARITVSDNLTPTIAGGGTTTGGQGGIAIRVGMTVMISANAGATTLYNKALVTAVINPGDPAAAQEFDVAYYEAAGQSFSPADTLTVFVYGSEYRKGSSGLTGSFESDSYIFENNPIIIRDRYEVNGSDMLQMRVQVQQQLFRVARVVLAHKVYSMLLKKEEMSSKALLQL